MLLLCMGGGGAVYVHIPGPIVQPISLLIEWRMTSVIKDTHLNRISDQMAPPGK